MLHPHISDTNWRGIVSPINRISKGIAKIITTQISSSHTNQIDNMTTYLNNNIVWNLIKWI